MIKRILNPNDLKKLSADIAELNPRNDYNFVTYNLESLYHGFAHKSVLAWEFFVWANLQNDKYTGYIAFLNHKSQVFNEKVFQEYGWFSSDKKSGYKLLVTALKFAKDKKFDCVAMSSVVDSPKHKKLNRFYEKMGFKADSLTYIAKL
jgi:hypothetical protein